MKACKKTSIVIYALLCVALMSLAFGASAQNGNLSAKLERINQRINERIDERIERLNERLEQRLGNSGSNRRAEPGAVYVNTNQIGGNDMVAFRRAADGTLSRLQTISTGGTGTAGPTESQDAVVLNEDHTLLFAVNLASSDISVFRVNPDTFMLTFVQRIDTGGDRPVSLDVRGDLLYVVNSGLRSGVSGFRIAESGILTPIESSIQPLSFGDASPFGDVTLPCTNIFPALEAGVVCSATQPAEVEFSPDGKFLIVSERLTNQFSIYELDENGVAGNRRSRTSEGESPFGMHFTPRGQLLVAEAFLDRPGEGAASSYDITDEGDTDTITDSIETGQSTSCWIEITPDGRFAFITNPGNASITALRILGNGKLRLVGDDGVVAASNDPRDVDISPDGRYLYVLNNVAGSVNGFRVNRDGTLEQITTTGATLPVFGLGLAAF